jgi:hypothetical protein
MGIDDGHERFFSVSHGSYGARGFHKGSRGNHGDAFADQSASSQAHLINAFVNEMGVVLFHKGFLRVGGHDKK